MDFLRNMLGNDMEDPRTQATLAMAAQLLGGQGGVMQRLTSGMQDYGGSMSASKRQRVQDDERTYLMEQRKAQALQQAQKMQQDAANEAALRGQFSPTAGPEVESAGGAGQPTQFDPGSFLRANPGANIDGLKQAMALQEAMRGKAPKFSTSPQYDQQGRAYILAENGQMKYLDGVSARDKLIETDLGGKKAFRTEYNAEPLAFLAKTQTPDSIASNAIARNGQEISRRGQDMTDSRARDFNATQIDANSVKRAEAEQAKNLTKGGQLASFDTMLGTLDRLSAHPGLNRSVGLAGAFPTIPGSESANFQAELETFQSQAFIPMVSQLKGMGALSDAEGKKLTAAVGALNPKMGEKAFRASVNRITSEMQTARDRVSGDASKPAAPSKPGVDADKERRYQEWKAKQ